MTKLRNYVFRPLLAIFRLSSREPKFLLHILWQHTTAFPIYKLHMTQQSPDVEISPSRAHNIYSATLRSLEDNLKMASSCRNIYVSSIVIKRLNWHNCVGLHTLSSCPPQIPHRLYWNSTSSLAGRSQRLTTWFMELKNLLNDTKIGHWKKPSC